VREQDGLRALKVSVAGHYRVAVSFGLLDKGALKVADEFNRNVYLASQEEPQVSRHLIVAAAARVQFVACITYSRDKLRLDEAVNVFRVTTVEVSRLLPRAALDFFERGGDFAGFFFA
jgi:hypothetical protein